MSFVYFFAGGGGHDLLDGFALRTRFDGLPAVSVLGPEGRGPDGRAGVVFHAARRLPGDLVWQPEPGEPAPYWVGWDPAAVPRPAELQRPLTVVGNWVVLGDAQKWLVPLLHGAPGRPEHGLPLEPGVGPDGRVIAVLNEEYAALRAEVLALQGLLASWPDRADETFDFCVRLLGVAYRVGAAEVLALGLFDCDLQAAVIGASLDLFARLTAGANA